MELFAYIWQGKNTVPSSAVQSCVGSFSHRYNRRHLYGRAWEDGHGLSVCKLHDKWKGTCGRPGETTIQVLMDYFKFMLSRQPHELKGGSMN